MSKDVVFVEKEFESGGECGKYSRNAPSGTVFNHKNIQRDNRLQKGENQNQDK